MVMEQFEILDALYKNVCKVIFVQVLSSFCLFAEFFQPLGDVSAPVLAGEV